MSAPYSDGELIYSHDKHRYILTATYVSDKLNIDLTDVLPTSAVADRANVADRFLDRVSKIVYNYIYKMTFLPKKTERELALNQKYRGVMQDAMSEQLEWMLDNGDMSAISHIGSNGKLADKSDMQSAVIAPMVEDALMIAGITSVLCPRCENDITPDYGQEGY